MAHDPQYGLGSRIPGLGKVVEVKASTSFEVGDRVKAIAYTDCFGKGHAEVRGLAVIGVKHVHEAHGVAAYDRLDCELVSLGEALANRHTLPEIICVEAAARFFAHEDAHVPPTCMCGSVLSAVTFTCVRGEDCTARYQLSPFTLSAREYKQLHGEDDLERARR
jgi:hypothetical protein